MKLNYYPETDSLYIDLADRASVESREVTAGVVADFDAQGEIVGIDIDHASRTVDLSKVVSTSLPVASHVVRDT